MRRTASSTICFQDRSSRLGTGRDMTTTSPLAAGQVEGEDQVVDAVRGADLVADVDEDPLGRVGSGIASTWMPRIRYSCLARASSTWWATNVWVEVLFGAKT